ncbi:MAG: hypothetical protein ACK4N5_23610, partial [Myxococcales bacterium]
MYGDHEPVRLRVSGGQPPYRFAAKLGSVDEAGLYRAPAPASGAALAADPVTVTDETGATAEMVVRLFRPITAATLEVEHGVERRLEVEGGRPPYRFAFAPGGNTSDATLEGSLYRAGPHPGRVDRVLVTDASEQTATFALKVRWPSWPLENRQLLVGDFDGNRTQDFVALNTAGASRARLAFFAVEPGRLPALVFDTPTITAVGAAVLDVNQDGVDDLVMGALSRLVVLAGGPDGPKTTVQVLPIGSCTHSELVALDTNGDATRDTIVAPSCADSAPCATESELALYESRAGQLAWRGCQPFTPGEYGQRRLATFRYRGDRLGDALVLTTTSGNSDPLSVHVFPPALNEWGGFVVTTLPQRSPNGTEIWKNTFLGGGDVDGDGFKDLVFRRQRTLNLTSSGEV